MNSYVIPREQYSNETSNISDNTFYKTDDIIRKVWVVDITYENNMFTDKDIYFVDCTTGEIIGGDSIR